MSEVLGTPKVRVSEGLPSRTYSLAGKTRVTHIHTAQKLYCTPGHPFSVCKTPTHIISQVRWEGSCPVLQVWKLAGGQALTSGKAGHVVQGSHWLQAFTALSGKGMLQVLRALGGQRTGVSGKAGLVVEDSWAFENGWSTVRVRKLNNQGARGQG